ncbi:hypothetical protein IFT64_18905 [Oxalobacteraceae sp. CFBP 8753]|nr:hypothetical protein [Oxalobacteraceae sp. CFBP 8753]
MSPNDVRAAVYNQRKVLPREYQQGWYLCGDVTDEFFDRLRNGERMTESLDYFTVKGGQLFAVFTLQIREQQARFLLPLASEKSTRFVEQVERTGVFMSLGKGGATDALLVEFKGGRLRLRELLQASKRCGSLPYDVDPVILRLASLSMMQLEAVPSTNRHHVVAEVCLTVILDS